MRSDAMFSTPTHAISWLVIAPVILPLLCATITIMLRTRPRTQAPLAIAATAGIGCLNVWLLLRVLAHGPMAMTMGNWFPPFGITFAVDALGAVMSLAATVTTMLAAIFAISEIDEREARYGFYPLLLLMLMGVNGAFLTGDIFNLYVWFEVFVIASFGLIVLGGDKVQLDGAVKYCFLNLIATTLFLIATGYLYGTLGTLNMADLSGRIAAMPFDGPLAVIGVLYLLAFGMKAAAFPVYFWLPASYHTPKVVVSALFAGLLTKVGVYALIRTFTTIMPNAAGSPLSDIMMWVANATVLVGVIGALVQTDVRRLFSYLLLSGIGVMLIGLGLATDNALAATVFYAIHSVLVMTALYLMAGAIYRAGGSFSVRGLQGLYKSAPLLAVLFLVLAAALAGLPPFSGFWPKAVLVQAALAKGAYIAVAVLLVNGLLGTIALARAFSFMFWREGGAEAMEAGSTASDDGRAGTVAIVLPIAVMTIAAALIGIFPNALFTVAGKAADGLLAPAAYIDAVLGDVP